MCYPEIVAHWCQRRDALTELEYGFSVFWEVLLATLPLSDNVRIARTQEWTAPSESKSAVSGQPVAQAIC
jgi:hypothetical protein